MSWVNVWKNHAGIRINNHYFVIMYRPLKADKMIKTDNVADALTFGAYIYNNIIYYMITLYVG